MGGQRLTQVPTGRVGIMPKQRRRPVERPQRRGRWSQGIDAGAEIQKAMESSSQLTSCRIDIPTVTDVRHHHHNESRAKPRPNPEVTTMMRKACAIWTDVNGALSSPINGRS